MTVSKRMRSLALSPKLTVLLSLMAIGSTFRWHCAAEDDAGFQSAAYTNTALAFATVASLERGEVSQPDFSSVDYRARASTANLIDYCIEASCGACSQLPIHDPCQVRNTEVTV